jgi:hypothetical protein
MRSKWWGGGLLLAGLLTAGAVWAQDSMPLGKWWRNERVVQRLNLSADEVERLDAAFLKSRRSMIRLKSEVESQQFELETLLEADSLDDGAVMDRYRQLDAARSKLGQERFQFILEVRKIVGRERFQQLNNFRKMRQHPSRQQMQQRRQNRKRGQSADQ